MSEKIIMVEVVKRLERDLENFDFVLFFSGRKAFAEEWAGCIAEAVRLKDSLKKIRILSDSDILLKGGCNCAYRRVDKEEKEALERLYFMYDFSDRFFMLSDSRQYGGLSNYIETGLIAREEILQILLMQRAE